MLSILPGEGLSSPAGLKQPVTPVKYTDQESQNHQQHIDPVQGKEPRHDARPAAQQVPHVQGVLWERGMPTQFLLYGHTNIVTRTTKPMSSTEDTPVTAVRPSATTWGTLCHLSTAEALNW